ncbi:uncharacterized protein [Rutidosis leptorrhynchoides]|uniref:uncharacterized protein n=1 Tax=Rutidosis leptorrhynchoides TaxID=125765 RepID=UPI003A99472F
MTESMNGGREHEDDYMGDLSLFLPPEEPSTTSKLSKSSSKKTPNDKTTVAESSKKKFKAMNWQERRKIERERKQQEEDGKTLVSIEAPISQSNIGFKLLKQMGYTPGTALGKDGLGLVEPVGLDIRRSRAGIGREDHVKEKMKRVEIEAHHMRRKEEDLMEDFGSRQKLQWRNRRIVVNFRKAKAALDQLENREIVVEKEEDEDGGKEEEEEEEEITEEDLQDILMKLRDEHLYCLFCGFQYESKEAISSNCPGLNEDDH